MLNVEIEKYCGEYNQEVVDLILNIQTKEFGVAITLNDQPDLTTIEQFYQKGAGNFWIARVGPRVVGTVALIDIGSEMGALRKMFVASEYRGKEKGVAHGLLSELVNWARQQGLKEIFLGTMAHFHGAHRFYEKSGFQEVRKDQLPPNFPAMSLDTKFYRLLVEGNECQSFRETEGNLEDLSNP